MNYYELLWIYYECILWVLESNVISGVGEWNTLLNEMRDVVLWSCGFTAGLEKMQW